MRRIHQWPETDKRRLVRRTAAAQHTAGRQTLLEWAARCTIIHPTRGEIPFQPYSYQRELLADGSPSRLVLKARQTGISLTCALESLFYALQARERILFISKTLDDARQLLLYVDQIYSLLAEPGVGLVRQNLSEMVFENGSHIRSLPASKTAGRGFTVTRVYLDEFAFSEYAADIYRAVRPTLSRGGQLTVLSTPDGLVNLFYQLWMGIVEVDWSKHRIHWSDCPEYDDAWYARERPNYTQRDWASEYECDFVASGEAVFDHELVRAQASGWVGFEAARIGGRYITAWDIGRRRDATVGVTLDTGARYTKRGAFASDDWQIVAYERHLGLSYPKIQAAIEARAALYSGPVYVESNGVGDPVIENLNLPVSLEQQISLADAIEYDDATLVMPFTTTAKSKQNAITALALAVEHGALKHDVRQLRNEQLSYQWNDTHLVQDSVMAAAIACWAAERAIPASVWVGDDHDDLEIGPRI